MAAAAQRIRRLRRTQDQFVYEPVFVGTFEDAILATLVNPHLQAVVITEGFPWASSHDIPLLSEVLARSAGVDASDAPVGDHGLALTRAVKKIRPELDVYLLDDSRPEDVVSDPDASGLRRVFSTRSRNRWKFTWPFSMESTSAIGRRFSTT